LNDAVPTAANSSVLTVDVQRARRPLNWHDQLHVGHGSRRPTQRPLFVLKVTTGSVLQAPRYLVNICEHVMVSQL